MNQCLKLAREKHQGSSGVIQQVMRPLGGNAIDAMEPQ